MDRLRLLFAYPKLTALALGALAALGFQPLGLWPLTLLGLAGLLELTARAPDRRAALRNGWLFGFGHFLVGFGWIATAFVYQAKMPAWLGWVAVALIAMIVAVYPALAALGGWLLRGRGPLALAGGFAAAWIVAEWLRSWVFTGFAWNPLGGIALGPFGRPGLFALAPWLGTYAVSGLVALLGAAWWLALRRGRIDWLGAVFGLVPAGLLLVPFPLAEAGPETLRYTLVQPDIRQEVLNDPANFESQFQKTAALSRPQQAGERRLVLWPESGVSDYLREGYPPHFYLDNFASDPVLARRRLGLAIGPGAMLLSGTADLEVEGGRAVGARNAVTALDGSGTIRGGYAKAHLVPGGEYLPLRWLLEPLGAERLVPGSIDFWPGPGPRTLDLGAHGKAGVQICYEIIFSGQVTDRTARPDFIYNPSNDGWYGAWGQPQFLAQARLRAIEEGLPVLRSTTTGISAVIDADGVVRQHVPRHVAGRLDGFVPPAKPPTLFARLGNALPLGWAVLLLCLTLVASRRRPG